MRDLQYAVRMLRKDVTFASVAIVTIALATGANAVVFALVNGILLRPLSFPRADRIVAVVPRPDGPAGDTAASSGPDFDDFRDAATSFSALGAVIPAFTMTITGNGDPHIAHCTAVSPELFDVLGMKPMLGRTFRPEEYHIDGGSVILAEGYWRREYGGDPSVLGRRIVVNGGSGEIIGVMPAVRDVFDQTDLWLTYIPDFEWARQRDNRFLSLIGLLKPGVRTARAAEEMTAIFRRMPGVRAGAGVDVTSLQQRVTGAVAPSLIMLGAAVLLVLLIACVNLATLTLARGGRRRREIAIRLGLGASRGRIARQLVTEMTLLSVAGSAMGAAIAFAAVRLVAQFNPGNLPRIDAVRVDASALLYIAVLCCGVVAIVGLVPALSFTRGHLFDVLRARGHEASAPAGRRHARALAAAEIALAVVLLTGAGLLLRSFWILRHAPLGFDPGRVLTFYVRLSDQQSPASRAQFYRELLEFVPDQPRGGIAAVSDCLPTAHTSSADLVPVGVPFDRSHPMRADACFVSPDYFRALAIPIRLGRAFDSRDTGSSTPIAIVSESVARRLWPGEDPVGKRLTVNYQSLGRPTDEVPVERMVAGVVGDVRNQSIESDTGLSIYLPYLQDATARSWRSMTLFVRMAGTQQDATSVVRSEILRLNPDVPVTRIATIEDVLDKELANRRLTTGLLSGFAALALLLAAVGLYGVMAQSVAQRTHEIGVRIALGATPRQVLADVLGQAGALVAIGLAIGVAGSWLATRAMHKLVYGVGTTDVASFVGAAAVLILIAAVASVSPAMRAAAVDPVVALNTD